MGTLTLETTEVILDESYGATHAGSMPGRYLVLNVSDTGSGMSREVQSHLFEPFFTTKPVGQGTGLGLATVYGIITQNEGFINVYSEPGHGTSFRIYFPFVGEESGEEISSPQTAVPRGGSETVLLVEDETGILDVSKLILESFGYRVLTASAPDEALQLAESHPGAIDVLVTDVIMPQMNGRDLSRRLLSLHPRMKCLFISGYTADVIGHQGLLDQGVHFLSKPFAIPDLAAKIREVLAAGEAEP